MVQQGDFTIQLVEANTKQAFNGKTYVEVEPGVEYFISISKPSSAEFSHAVVLAKYYVDGKDLGYYTYFKTIRTHVVSYKGLYKYENGVSSTCAFKFVTPKVQGGGKSISELAAGGKVEVKIF